MQIRLRNNFCAVVKKLQRDDASRLMHMINNVKTVNEVEVIHAIQIIHCYLSNPARNESRIQRLSDFECIMC